MSASRLNLWVLLLGLFVLSATLFVSVKCDESDDYDDDFEDYENEPDEASGDVDDKDVVVLDDSNFESKVEIAEFSLVEFYAPWCGHCKNLAPEYAKAATELKASHPNVMIAKVDATENEALSQKFEIEGFPTIKWIVDGDTQEYTGGRTASSIVQWIKKKTGPPANKLDSLDAFKQAEKDSDVVVVGYFAKLEGSEHEAFIKVARTEDDVAFFETTNTDVAKAAGIKASSGVSVTKNFEIEERSQVAFTGSFEGDELKTFVAGHKGPLVPPFSEKYQPYIFDGDHKQVFIVTDKDTLAKEDTMKPIRAVAEKQRGKLMFVQVDRENEEASRVVEFFGLSNLEQGQVQLIGYDINEGKKYFFKKDLDEGPLGEWAKEVVEGTAEIEYKSDEIPTGNDAKDGEVVVVVGKSVESIVNDPTKDVLLEVYAPWCGHCKQLAPIYKKLAKRFSIVDSVVIAKMDGTTNEHAAIDAEGFPTLLFFPAQEGAKPVKYDQGDRSLAALTKFIKEHAKVPYELPKKQKEDKEEEQVEL